MRIFLLLLAVVLMPIAAAEPAPEPADPDRWLEEVAGEKQLEWVKARNAEAVAALAEGDGFASLERRLLAILDSDDKIPFIRKIGDRYYNFWRDAAHPRGLWRRTTLAEYRGAEPAWETVIDLDALAESEGENWVWHGAAVRCSDRRACDRRATHGRLLRRESKAPLARHLPDCLGETHGPGGGGVSARVPSVWRRHPAQSRPPEGAGSLRTGGSQAEEGQDGFARVKSAPDAPWRTARTAAHFSRSRAAHRLGRTRAAS